MSPYKMSGTTGVSFSGGRTSAYMLRQVLDHNDDLGDLIVTFANTGKEHPATLDFVKECSERWAVPIVWLEFRDDEQGLAIVNYETASRDGQPFEDLIRKRSYDIVVGDWQRYRPVPLRSAQRQTVGARGLAS